MSIPEKPTPPLKFDVSEPLKTPPPAAAEAVPKTRYHWFATAPGRRVVGVAAAAGCLGVTFVKIAPHSVALNYVKDIYTNYTNGLPTKPSRKIVQLVDQVCDDIGLSSEEREQLKPFVTTQTEPFTWGGFWERGRKYGVLLGYPLLFHWNSPKDVPMDRMRVGDMRDSGDNVGFTRSAMASPEAKTFRESTILSEEAKKFAICREINRARSFSFVFSSVLPGCWMAITYLMGRHANKKFGLFRAPFRPLHRMILYLGLMPTMWVSYILLKDAHGRNTEASIDSASAGVCKEYAKGGVEYYEKMMDRNASLRSLDPSLKKMYNIKGDLKQGFFRTKLKPIFERKLICEEKLAEFEATEKSMELLEKNLDKEDEATS